MKPGDRLIVRIEKGTIILQPLRPKEALEILETIADRYLGGPRRIKRAAPQSFSAACRASLSTSSKASL
ncbi:hypothetical protein [Thermofilum sp.]|uniref:hypothetical protein n=1 Tax=Thermofilum sp. TaxID=1961369 RepID=UPI00386A8EF1